MSGEHASDSKIDRPRRALITLAVIMASFMQAVDTTIANVALPRIQGSLSASLDQMGWVLTSYIIAAAIMTPLSGWLAGQIGRRRVFLFSVGGFTVASMFCGLAQSLPEIVLARLLQGLCGAALIPMTQAVLLDINPPEHHARAMAIWVMSSTLAPILGPVLGGWITENYTWRWVFYINVPIGSLAFLGLLSTLPESAIRKSRFDFFGFSALSLSIGALQLVLDRGQMKDWFSSTEICIEALVAAAALYLFSVHMLTTTRERFVSLSLFKDRNFLAGNALIFAVGVVLFATLALLPTFLQELLNYPAVTTGLVIAPRGIGSMISLYMMGRITGRIDARMVIAVGFGMAAFSAWQMTGFNLQMDSTTIAWSGLAQGLGTGLIYVPVSVAAFSTLPPALRNEGTALFSLTRNIGSGVGIAVVEALLTRNTQIVHSTLAEHVTYFNPVFRKQFPGAPTMDSLAGLNVTVTRQAAMIAYNNNFKLLLLLCLAAIPLVLLLRKSRPGVAAPVATE
jgi:DHA2 family multidrug resistance protein